VPPFLALVCFMEGPDGGIRRASNELQTVRRVACEKVSRMSLKRRRTKCFE